jgi:hypothetical protein
VRYAKRDGHDLDHKNADLPIDVSSIVIDVCVDVGEEAGVGVKANADAMDEEGRKAGGGWRMCAGGASKSGVWPESGRML